MKKILLFLTCLSLVYCKKKDANENLLSVADSVTTSKPEIISIDSAKIPPAIVEVETPPIVWNTFSELPARFSNDSDAVANLYTDEKQLQSGGKKYGACDFINNVVVLKLNGTYEKLNDISGNDTYLENKIYENANYRLELNLNKPVPKKLENEILRDIPLDGAYVLKGTLKLIDLKSDEHLTKNTIVLGF